MVISHVCKLIFVHIPKTGGSSITGALRVLDKKSYNGRVHTPFCDVIKTYPDNLDYYKFTIVRNPWGRLFSYFSAGNRINKEFTTPENFSKFIQTVKNSGNKHIMSNTQCYYIDCDSIQLDFIGRFETLTTDFQFVINKLGFQVPLKNLNSSLLHPSKSYKDFYNQEGIDFVTQHYAEDIKRFGYTFEG